MRRLLSCMVVLLLAGSCRAQLPALYRNVNRVTWVVENIDRARAQWEKLGLKDIQEFPNIALPGEYEGKPVTIYAWQITGHLGNLTVDMIQPAEGQLNAYTHFLEKHGDGIFSIVHEAPTQAAMAAEIARMKAKGVGVLQQVKMPKQDATFTYFDTEGEGKFNLGLVYRPGGMKALSSAETDRTMAVSLFGFDVRDLPSVSAYWMRLGFPALRTEHAAPQADLRYGGQPLALAFEVGRQQYDQFRYEWIAASPTPENVYADYLKAPHHREGIEYIGMPVADLKEAIAQYQRMGFEVRQSGTWGDPGKAGSGEFAYMDTEAQGGVTVELVHPY